MLLPNSHVFYHFTSCYISISSASQSANLQSSVSLLQMNFAVSLTSNMNLLFPSTSAAPSSLYLPSRSEMCSLAIVARTLTIIAVFSRRTHLQFITLTYPSEASAAQQLVTLVQVASLLSCRLLGDSAGISLS